MEMTSFVRVLMLCWIIVLTTETNKNNPRRKNAFVREIQTYIMYVNNLHDF